MTSEAESHSDAPPRDSGESPHPPAQPRRRRWLDALGWVILLILLYFVGYVLVDYGRWMILPVPKLW